MRKEITLLGALHIAVSILYVLAAVALTAVLYSKGVFKDGFGMMTEGEIVCAVLTGFLFIFACAGFAGGCGIIGNHEWARTLVLILGCLNLVSVPLGIALGVYTIRIFLKESGPRHGMKLSLAKRRAEASGEAVGYHFSLLKNADASISASKI